MKLSTRTRYTPFILIDLALHQERGPVQTGEMSGRLGISVKYIEQLIKTLRKAGIVAGVRGPKGGYVLSLQPERITLGQIVRCFEGSFQTEDCVTAPKACRVSSNCIVRSAWKRASEDMLISLDRISLADLLHQDISSKTTRACTSFKLRKAKGTAIP